MKRDQVLALLDEIQGLIRGYVDVTDGGPLGPNPNDAMKASKLIDQAFAADWDETPALPRVKDGRAQVEIASAADRAMSAVERAISEPNIGRHRSAIEAALNYIESIVREEQPNA